MTIHHHLDAATIIAYAAGSLGEALSMVAASHVAWCPECRKAVREAEELGGEILSGLEDTEVSESCRARVMGMLDRATLHRFPRPPAPKSNVPSPLSKLLSGQDLAGLKWKTKAPGVAMYDLPLSPAAKGKLYLLRIAPGKAMPEHSHGGEEITLIISGAYTDSMGRFAQGDVADLDESTVHTPRVEPDAPCYCLVATEAPTRFKSWPARLLQPFIGI